MTHPGWWHDDTVQVGTDFANPAEVEAYDRKMERFRNYKAEARSILDALNLPAEASILEIGTGPGHFIIEAARQVRRACAIDVSEGMLEVARKKAAAAGLEKIEFAHGGFLSYEHQGVPFDAIVTNAAFHHLTDFWKMVAFQRMHAMLRTRGAFYLGDVVFSFAPNEFESRISEWLKALGDATDEDFRRQAETHIREEYSTFDWVIEGMAQRAGFTLEWSDKQPLFARYLFRKAED